MFNISFSVKPEFFGIPFLTPSQLGPGFSHQLGLLVSNV